MRHIVSVSNWDLYNQKLKIAENETTMRCVHRMSPDSPMALIDIVSFKNDEASTSGESLSLG
jgi:hypothetical protein